jgi:hypothetical protein
MMLPPRPSGRSQAFKAGTLLAGGTPPANMPLFTPVSVSTTDDVKPSASTEIRVVSRTLGSRFSPGADNTMIRDFFTSNDISGGAAASSCSDTRAGVNCNGDVWQLSPFAT